jgi:hypothetical protein
MSHNRTLFFLSLTCLGDFASPLLVARWESILIYYNTYTIVKYYSIIIYFLRSLALALSDNNTFPYGQAVSLLD